MEPGGSLSHSQVPATCPYPEPYQSAQLLLITPIEDPSQYYPPVYVEDLTNHKIACGVQI